MRAVEGFIRAINVLIAVISHYVVLRGRCKNTPGELTYTVYQESQ